ncbi:FG-GAP-like repeat-containing protein [Puia sp. P3]|uniref:FG-GAP-like repeat-containing protein n=1 Tax=Puia sp. P3 TaxID=3423952 RepID=UPI003D66CE27
MLRWPPSYGSSYFELADFNGDGFADIVYTCGDNADFSPVLKPYHGVYIYLNDGHNSFRPWYFFPINGCYKAVARDFDGDGDLDLAAIAFFRISVISRRRVLCIWRTGAGGFQAVQFA